MIFIQKHRKKIGKTLLVLFAGYLLYALICSSFMFRIHEPTISTNDYEEVWVQNISKEAKPTDKVVLLEDPLWAAKARIDMINEAEDSLLVAYHALHPDESTEIFLSLLVNAADRGVEVQILLDGVFHNLRGKEKQIVYTFIDHPHITLKYYEPLDLLKPWTWNNRLHDKLIIADDRFAMIGGRNMGNKYFVEDEKNFVNDRDVMIMKSDQHDASVIDEMRIYFDQLWTHTYSKPPKSSLTKRQKKRAQAKHEQLLTTLTQHKGNQDHLFNKYIDWDRYAIEVDQITFIHNPIQRLNKEPWVWLAINDLMQSAQETIIIESPYIIPTERMLAFTDSLSITHDNVTIFTNSIASTPNVLAFSGYQHHAKDLLDIGVNIFEHRGEHSIHGKSYIVDNKISVIGSYNLDARSTFLSTESMVIIESEEFADQLIQLMRDRVEQGKMVELTNGPVEESFSVKLKQIFVTLLSYVTYFYQHLL